MAPGRPKAMGWIFQYLLCTAKRAVIVLKPEASKDSFASAFSSGPEPTLNLRLDAAS